MDENMTIADDRKVDVMLALLLERYNAAHQMRARSTQFALWILGFAVALAWKLMGETTLFPSQKWVLLLFVTVIGGLSIMFLKAIAKGFVRNKRVMKKSEAALGLYSKGVFLPNDSIFPENYREDKAKWSWHFITLYIWIVVVVGMVAALVVVNPYQQKQDAKPKPQITEKGAQ